MLTSTNARQISWSSQPIIQPAKQPSTQRARQPSNDRPPLNPPLTFAHEFERWCHRFSRYDQHCSMSSKVLHIPKYSWIYWEQSLIESYYSIWTRNDECVSVSINMNKDLIMLIIFTFALVLVLVSVLIFILIYIVRLLSFLKHHAAPEVRSRCNAQGNRPLWTTCTLYRLGLPSHLRPVLV